MNIQEWPVSKLVKLTTPLDFNFGPFPKILNESIRKVGVIQMPLLLESSSQTTLISGKRRIQILYQLKADQTLPVQVYNATETSFLQAFHLHLFENLTVRKFNPIEKSNILRILMQDFHLSTENILSDYLACLDLPPTIRTIRIFQTLQNLDEVSKELICSGNLQVDTALELEKFENIDRLWILNLIRNLHLGVNPQKMLVKLVWEISKKTRTPVAELIEQETFNQILHEEKWSSSQKWALLERELKHRRFPILTQLEDQFTKLKKAMRLPPSLSLQSSPYFETPEYLIQWRFKNIQEYKRELALLNTISQKKELEELFHLTGENGQYLHS